MASICDQSELVQLICTCGGCSKNEVCSNNPVAEDDLPIGIWHIVSSVSLAELHYAVHMLVMCDKCLRSERNNFWQLLQIW
jgi:hypothetical protein